MCSADTEKLEQLRTKYLHKLFGILCIFLYLVIGPVIYIIITHGYLFYTLDYNLIQLNFVPQIVQALATGAL